MIKNIFLKTLYQKRWGMLWWSLAMLAMTVFVVVLFPTFQDSFGSSLQDVPESMRAILGEAADYQRIEGFLELQVFMQMIFLTFIYGIILYTGLIAGEEGEGTLQTLLAQPVSRTRVYFEKLLAGMVILAVVSLALAAGTILGVLLIGESVSVSGVMQVTFAQWLVSMALSLVGFAVGSAIGSRGMAGALAGVFAFVSYLVTSLVGTVKALEPLNYLSPFRYFNNSRILDNGLDFGNMAVLAIFCVVLIIVGWLLFVRRDVYSR